MNDDRELPDVRFPYDEAEDVPASDRTLAQWARAQAVKAIKAGGDRPAGDLRGLADEVNILAELIITGSLPDPPAGVTY